MDPSRSKPTPRRGKEEKWDQIRSETYKLKKSGSDIGAD
jgi:hypothetical protein